MSLSGYLHSERKLEPIPFLSCLPSRLNAMLQMMLNAAALRSHDASNVNISTNARILLLAAPALCLPSASARLRP
jgi:hypothetical protein